MPSISQSTLPHACAECKRLKLRCDKKIPCSACVRRGCPQICPDGQLTAGRGTRSVMYSIGSWNRGLTPPFGRFILSNTKELHEENDSLRDRVKELEQALADLQSQVTCEPHPLLKDTYKLVSEKLSPVTDDVKVEEDDGVDTFGSLTISPDGKTTW